MLWHLQPGDTRIHFVAVSYKDRAVCIYQVDRKTRVVKEIFLATENLGQAPKENPLDYCHTLAVDSHNICGICEPGVLWVWGNHEDPSLKKVLSLPEHLKDIKVTSLHILNV